MQCAFCGRPIEPNSTWKGSDDQFYCSEFCADSEAPEEAAPAPAQPTLLDHHLKRPYERLQQLLPHMRAYSGKALAAARVRATLSQVA
jgi:hypothetical protein